MVRQISKKSTGDEKELQLLRQQSSVKEEKGTKPAGGKLLNSSEIITLNG